MVRFDLLYVDRIKLKLALAGQWAREYAPFFSVNTAPIQKPKISMQFDWYTKVRAPRKKLGSQLVS